MDYLCESEGKDEYKQGRLACETALMLYIDLPYPMAGFENTSPKMSSASSSSFSFSVAM